MHAGRGSEQPGALHELRVERRGIAGQFLQQFHPSGGDGLRFRAGRIRFHHVLDIGEQLLPAAAELAAIGRPGRRRRRLPERRVVEPVRQVFLRADRLDQAAQGRRVGLLPVLERQLHVLNRRNRLLEQGLPPLEHGPLHVEGAGQARPAGPAQRRDLPERNADGLQRQDLDEALQILIGVGAVAGATAHRLEQPEVVVVLERADGQARETGELVDLIPPPNCAVTHKR